MKVNWKAFVTLVVLVGTIYWCIDSLRTRSYSGTNLNFGVGSGPVLVTNPSDGPIPVRLIGAQVGTFIVTSRIEGVAGRSVTQREGRTTTQLFEFALPPGSNEFTVARAADVNFVGSASVPLEATVYPLGTKSSQATVLVTVLIMLASLFFLSRLNDHRWVSASRRQKALDQAVLKEAERQTFRRVTGRTTSGKS